MKRGLVKEQDQSDFNQSNPVRNKSASTNRHSILEQVTEELSSCFDAAKNESTIDHFGLVVGKLWDIAKERDQGFLLTSEFGTLFVECLVEAISSVRGAGLDQIFGEKSHENPLLLMKTFEDQIWKQNNPNINEFVVKAMILMLNTQKFTSADDKRVLEQVFSGFLAVFVLKLYPAISCLKSLAFYNLSLMKQLKCERNLFNAWQFYMKFAEFLKNRHSGLLNVFRLYVTMPVSIKNSHLNSFKFTQRMEKNIFEMCPIHFAVTYIARDLLYEMVSRSKILSHLHATDKIFGADSIKGVVKQGKSEKNILRLKWMTFKMQCLAEQYDELESAYRRNERFRKQYSSFENFVIKYGQDHLRQRNSLQGNQLSRFLDEIDNIECGNVKESAINCQAEWETCIKVYEGNLIADVHASEVLREALQFGSIETDPIETLFRTISQCPARSTMNNKVIDLQVRIRKILWNVILMNDPYNLFLEQMHMLPLCNWPFDHNKLERGRL